jgi:hypothetical protein
MPVFVTQERRYHAGELVRRPDGEFSSIPFGATYEEMEDDVRQYVFPCEGGTARVVTYTRYDFIACDTDPLERGLRATVWSDRALDAGERERVIAALTGGDTTPPSTVGQR